ncbi:MAG TPA: pilus assembly protein [Reyranella sp.]|nr:pilus assembly protein [Reyranella sp.]
MKHFIRELWRRDKGATAVMFGMMATGLVGTVGLSVDIGKVMAAQSAFTASAQSSALAGAYSLLQANATQDTVSAAVSSWNSAHAPKNVTVTNTSTTLSCVTSTANLPSCTTGNPNVVNVTQTGTVQTNFLKVFGYSSFTLTASSSAAKAGGIGTPLNVMFVLDSTASMGSADSNCTVPGVKSPTRYQCAQYSVQSVLKVMQPSMASVGLMTFPGTAKQYAPGKPCPTQPSATPYLSSTIYYQIGSGTSLSTNYNSAGVLNDTSSIVEAVGDFTASKALTGCLSAKGGEGTYIAEVLTKAQAALPVVTGTKNVIILLSDGDAGATAAQLNNQTSKVTKQCGQYVTAAQNATTAGTTVYTVAYGAPTSGCSSGDTYTPCTALKAAASDTTKFYSTGAPCAASLSSNNASNLPTIFTQIAVNLTKPRLL